jgi:hypothetical protein
MCVASDTGNRARGSDIPFRYPATRRWLRSGPGGGVPSRLDLLGKCGLPTLVEDRPAQVTERVGGRAQGASRTVTVALETWTCDLGPRALVRLVHVGDGRVTGVRTGGYGYSE